jgi:hypothetical protein
MVLLNAAKAARNQASIINRPTCGGTAKKGGLAPTIGTFLSSNPSLLRTTHTQLGLVCMGNYSNPSQSALRAIRRY